ncbi:hypothetical protein DPMN_029474 [Dreissena polymorpha]|uniref:Ly-6/neurotoxin-like protein 1 n=1 Tax=Dreissena polymorpha TaxID=45954 RepID=A0A9D4M0W9_DREPO|nr:hypothetical protein DPMN_029474 [Dreissena polymorpha]
MKEHKSHLIIIAALVLTQISSYVALDCYNCRGVHDVRDCNATTTCGANQESLGYSVYNPFYYKTLFEPV